MLIVRSAFAKILPESMHSRWDTWSNVWLSDGLFSPIVLGTALTGTIFASSSSTSTLQRTLLCTSFVGFSVASVTWKCRRKKDWTLPHDAWKDACAKIEKKLQHIVYQPHLYRVRALCDLSSVLKDAELKRIGTERQQVREEDMSEYDTKTYVGVWTNDYAVGNISVKLLAPDVLNEIHLHLGFNQNDLEQWVEASYLQRICEDLKSPLPGTTDSIVRLANDNPAILAFYLRSVEWDETPASMWFSKTQWPSVVAVLQDVQEQIPTNKTKDVPSAMELYKHVMRGKQAQTEPTFDGGLFEIVPECLTLLAHNTIPPETHNTNCCIPISQCRSLC